MLYKLEKPLHSRLSPCVPLLVSLLRKRRHLKLHNKVRVGWGGVGGVQVLLPAVHYNTNDYEDKLLLIQISLFHLGFFNSIMDKTPTHAPFTQH